MVIKRSTRKTISEDFGRQLGMGTLNFCLKVPCLLEFCYSTWHVWTSHWSNTWELFRNAEFQTSSKIYWLRICISVKSPGCRCSLYPEKPKSRRLLCMWLLQLYYPVNQYHFLLQITGRIDSERERITSTPSSSY